MNLARFGAMLLVPAALAFSTTAVAQEAASPEAIPPVACTVEPISYQELSSLIADPATPPAPTIVGTPEPLSLPVGEPADEDTAVAVRGTIDELVSCLNAGDTMKVLALYSDRFVSEAFAGVDLSEADYEAEAANTTPREPGNEIVLFAYGDVVLLEDGRAAVLVLGDDQLSPGPASQTLFYLLEEDGEWRIDQTVETPAEDEP